MNVHRSQGGTGSLNTHQCAFYRRAWVEGKRMTDDVQGFVVDPFARRCPWADYRNDINPNIVTTTHTMDAIDFLDEMLEQLGEQSCRIILFDPPFSERQATRYEGDHVNIYTVPGYTGDLGKRMWRLLKPGGVVIKLGFNSNAPAPGMDLRRAEMVAFGGTRNDVIVTHWRRPNESLEPWVPMETLTRLPNTDSRGTRRPTILQRLTPNEGESWRPSVRRRQRQS